MITKVLKRDGRKVNFNIERIAKSIYKAANSIGGQDYTRSEELSEKVYEKLEEIQEDKQVSSENIQKVVEQILEEDHISTLRVYKKFREERNKTRERNSEIIKIYKGLTFDDAINNNVKRENANINADTAMGTMLKYGSEGAKNFYHLCVLKPAHSEAHKNGDIHIHDLDFLTLTTTCCQIDLIKLFKDGFCTGEGFLREPQSIGSYAALAAIAIQSNQNDQHGGQSIPNFEYAMAKGVRVTYKKEYLKNLIKALELLTDLENPQKVGEYIVKSIKYDKDIVASYKDSNGYLSVEKKYLSKYGIDNNTIDKIQKFTVKYTDKEVENATYQAMESFIHNLNTMHSRAGAQVPFSSINYGLDTSPEGRLVMQKVLQATEDGLGNGETPIFPIQIFRVKEGINYNPEDPNYDLFKLSCKVSAKRLFPNFSFIDAPFNLQYYRKGDYDTEVAYMGCRTRVMGNVYDKTREVTCGRGNLSFTSVNLPRLGIEAHGDVEKFFEMLDEKIDLVIDQLKSRFEIQSNKRVYNYPFLMGQHVWLDSDKLKNTDKVGEILKHGTLTMGFIGLAECLKALIGKHHGESEEARELGLKIIGHMRERMNEQSKKDKLNFTLIATPAEGLAGRFVKIDKKKYGVIEGVTDREYYTNSFHVPVYYKISAFNKIKIEAPYHELTNGGHISYVELDGDPTKNLEAFEQIIRCMKESGIGYGSINHPVDRDPVCGYTGIIKELCPCCGRKEFEEANHISERIKRIKKYN